MDKKISCMKLAYWTDIIKKSKSSRMKISEWCATNQISVRKYYYWHKKVMHDTYDLATKKGLLPAPELAVIVPATQKTPEFTELSLLDKAAFQERTDHSGISIKYNSFTIFVDQGFSERELAKVLQVMNNVQ